MAEDYSLLIVSDLHLSEGRNPETGKVSRNEDFFFDDDFSAFLRFHQDSAGKWKLVINGDFIDFLQVTSQPDPSESDLLTDRIYGLKTGAVESVWKLKRVAQGHQELFGALSRFAVENQVAIVGGNHDIEFFYPQVQQAFLEELETHVPSNQRAIVRNNIEFFSWFYLDGNLYVEHGHQYDPLNSFTHILDPRLPHTSTVKASEQEHIDLPLGSLFVRYLFNRVEVSTPFADNIKPATRFISWFLANHPIQALGFLFKEGREMFRRLKRKWQWVSSSAFVERRTAHKETLEGLAAALAGQEGRTPKEEWGKRLGALNELRTPSLMRGPTAKKWRILKMLLGPVRTPALFLLVFAVTGAGLLQISGPLIVRIIPALLLTFLEPLRTLLEPWWPVASEIIRSLFLLELLIVAAWTAYFRRWRKKDTEAAILRERARQIIELMRVKYVVMGHTHDADIYDIGNEQHYFNSGTWTKVFGEEEKILREEKEFTFVRITGKGEKRRARLMKWEGRSMAPRLAYLFASTEEL